MDTNAHTNMHVHMLKITHKINPVKLFLHAHLP